MIYTIALAAFLATILGGMFALAFRDRLHLILGFSAGAVIGVAFFDLMPEAIRLITTSSAGSVAAAHSASYALAFVALGFATYMVIDRFVETHGHHDDEHSHEHHHEKRGILGAGSLSVHSLLDGIAIGLAFQVSASIGIIVAVAVLAHDFSDGINTVNVILKNGGERKRAFRFLLVDAIAPVIGIIATRFFSLPAGTLGVILAIFAGFFLYIGASDLLPESHHNHPTIWTTLLTILGMALLFVVIKIAG